jgi:hypothetical protein
MGRRLEGERSTDAGSVVARAAAAASKLEAASSGGGSTSSNMADEATADALRRLHATLGPPVLKQP